MEDGQRIIGPEDQHCRCEVRVGGIDDLNTGLGRSAESAAQHVPGLGGDGILLDVHVHRGELQRQMVDADAVGDFLDVKHAVAQIPFGELHPIADAVAVRVDVVVGVGERAMAGDKAAGGVRSPQGIPDVDVAVDIDVDIRAVEEHAVVGIDHAHVPQGIELGVTDGGRIIVIRRLAVQGAILDQAAVFKIIEAIVLFEVDPAYFFLIILGVSSREDEQAEAVHAVRGHRAVAGNVAGLRDGLEAVAAVGEDEAVVAAVLLVNRVAAGCIVEDVVVLVGGVQTALVAVEIQPALCQSRRNVFVDGIGHGGVLVLQALGDADVGYEVTVSGIPEALLGVVLVTDDSQAGKALEIER